MINIWNKNYNHLLFHSYEGLVVLLDTIPQFDYICAEYFAYLENEILQKQLAIYGRPFDDVTILPDSISGEFEPLHHDEIVRILESSYFSFTYNLPHQKKIVNSPIRKVW